MKGGLGRGPQNSFARPWTHTWPLRGIGVVSSCRSPWMNPSFHPASWAFLRELGDTPRNARRDGALTPTDGKLTCVIFERAARLPVSGSLVCCVVDGPHDWVCSAGRWHVTSWMWVQHLRLRSWLNAWKISTVRQRRGFDKLNAWLWKHVQG